MRCACWSARYGRGAWCCWRLKQFPNHPFESSSATSFCLRVALLDRRRRDWVLQKAVALHDTPPFRGSALSCNTLTSRRRTKQGGDGKRRLSLVLELGK